MTTRVSPQKVSKMMRLFFSGTPQPTIAKTAGVDQSTVSIYASRFKNRVSEVGLSAAGKEFKVFEEVEGLRSLSVELSKANLTVEDAKRGLGILMSFMKLGIAPEIHTALIRVCKEIGDPSFVQAAVKLAKIEAQSNITHEQVMSRFENATSRLPSLEKKLMGMQAKMQSLDQSLAQRDNQIASLNAYITRLQDQAEAKKVEMENELAASMKQLNVKSREVEGVANLKKELAGKGLDFLTLAELAKEFAGESAKASGAKINEALAQYGSLREAVGDLEILKSALEKFADTLKKQTAELGQDKAKLLVEIKALGDKLSEQRDQLDRQSERVRRRDYQYHLFESFIAMVEGSPSVTKSIEDLIAMFQWLLESGWDKSLEPNQLRSIFVNNVLGQFVNCSRCTVCDTRFILSKGARSRFHLSHWCCPICHNTKLTGDDSLLQAIENS